MTDTGQAVRDALERIDDFMVEEIMNDQSDAPHRADDFNGDTEHLVDCIDALLDLDDAKALVPHGLGGKGSHAYRLLCAARQRLAALANLAPTDAEAIERAAQWLHDEGGFGDAWFNYTWPEHPDDTGQRDGGWVRIVPSDVQAKFREVARRMLKRFPAALPITKGEG